MIFFKYALLPAFFLLNLSLIYSQSPTLDAITVSKSIREGGRMQILNSDHINLLKLYYIEGADYETIRQNPFWLKYLPETEPQTFQTTTEEFTFGFSNVAGGGGGGKGFEMPGPQVLVGITNFLVRRAKTELGIVFFNQFKKKMLESQELQLLFPTAAQTLGQIEQDVFNFNAFWGTLKEGLAVDLDNHMMNLENYIRETRKIKNEDLRPLLGDLLRSSSMLKDRYSVTEVIRFLGNDGNMHLTVSQNDTIENFKQNMKLLSLISESLKAPDAEANRLWIDRSKLERLLNDEISYNIYLGILYAQSRNTPLRDKTVAAYLETSDKTVFANSIRGFYRNNTYIQDFYNSENPAPNTTISNKRTFEDYYKLTKQFIRSVEYGPKFQEALVGNNLKVDSTFYFYSGLMYDFNELFWSIHQKRYSSIVMNSLLILTKVLMPEKCGCVKEELMKYGTFIAAVVNSTDAVQIESAMETLTLPPGSASLKKYANFSVSLNAYVGLSMGQENLKYVGPKIYQSVATPIGISFNMGLKKAGSLSVMASLLDVGALSTYRFSDTTTNMFPDVKFENVLAPGAYLIYGVPKFPLSIGFGAQLGPNIRTLNANVSGAPYTIDKTSGWRFGAFIAVDIPVFNIFSSNKNKSQCRLPPKKKE